MSNYVPHRQGKIISSFVFRREWRKNVDVLFEIGGLMDSG